MGHMLWETSKLSNELEFKRDRFTTCKLVIMKLSGCGYWGVVFFRPTRYNTADYSECLRNLYTVKSIKVCMCASTQPCPHSHGLICESRK